MSRRCARSRDFAAVDASRDGCCAAGDGDFAPGRIPRTRGNIAAEYRATDRAARHLDFTFGERAAARRMRTIKRAGEGAARHFGFVLCSCARACRNGKVRTISGAADGSACDLDTVFVCAAARDVHFDAVGIGDTAARDFKYVLLCLARRGLEGAVRVVLLVFNQSAVCCCRERAARDGELVVLDRLSACRTPRPCLCVGRCFVVRRRVIAELMPVDVDILPRADRMIVCVNHVLKVALEKLFCSNGQICICRPLCKADTRCVVHRRKETSVVRARRKGKAAGFYFDPRPVESRGRTAADGEEGIRRRIAHGCRAVEIEYGLAEVRNTACRDVLRVDIQRIARHDVARRAARCAAVDECVAECGRVKRAITLAEVDGVARRLARAVRIAAVDFVTAAECSVFDVDGVALGITRRDVVRWCE